MARGKGREKYFEKVREKNKSIPDEVLRILLRQKYHIAGEHSAAKICHWTHSVLTGGIGCYKSKFYGIASHRCIQCTPVLLFCNHACVFCWRIMPEKSLKFEDMPAKHFKWDEPEKIADWIVEAQKSIISGYGGNPKVDKRRYEEALNPLHVALSLTGEPVIYPHLERLIEEFHKRKMTTFLVTNGTFPERIEKWKTYPTQLYVSMVAPNEEVYRKAIRPKSPMLWRKYLKMLELMPKISQKTRTVLRMTLTRGVNDSDLEGYARQIMVAQPHYVEVKSMVYVGGARLPQRGLSLSSMLTIEEVEKIAQQLAQMTGYIISDKHELSRVVLLCKDKEAEKNRMKIWRENLMP
ncbi:MAG: 4-demethylwyosine synthase TYW1 [Candidatus Micrarchaeota archaeon]|nr:4-demethylwyosine synthase TYW1 [Candidatus Micrarchaeota archaeon]